MKKLLPVLPLLISLTIGLAHTTTCPLTCPVPQNVAVSSLSGGNIAFDWDDCMSGCPGYKISYYRVEDDYSSGVFSSSVSAISFNNLPDGTYEFYFATVCGEQTSPHIIIEESIVN